MLSQCDDSSGKKFGCCVKCQQTQNAVICKQTVCKQFVMSLIFLDDETITLSVGVDSGDGGRKASCSRHTSHYQHCQATSHSTEALSPGRPPLLIFRTPIIIFHIRDKSSDCVKC